MANKIEQLKKNGDTVYPITVTEAVLTKNGKTIQKILEETQTKVDSMETIIGGKQDTLTAGNNIKIENNVISLDGDLTNIYSGYGTPDNITPVYGKYYINKNNGDFYGTVSRYGSTSWVVIGSIKITANIYVKDNDNIPSSDAYNLVEGDVFINTTTGTISTYKYVTVGGSTQLAWVQAYGHENKVKIVTELPSTPDAIDVANKTIYLVPNANTETNNIYDEYMYINNVWERVGGASIDLSGYAKTTDLDGKVDSISYNSSTGKFIYMKAGSPIVIITLEDLADKLSPIMPSGTSVAANVDIPSGTNPTELSNLKIDGEYYNAEKIVSLNLGGINFDTGDTYVEEEKFEYIISTLSHAKKNNLLVRLKLTLATIDWENFESTNPIVIEYECVEDQTTFARISFLDSSETNQKMYVMLFTSDGEYLVNTQIKDVAGGGSQLYRHDIIVNFEGKFYSQGNCYAYCSIINSNSNIITSINDLPEGKILANGQCRIGKSGTSTVSYGILLYIEKNGNITSILLKNNNGLDGAIEGHTIYTQSSQTQTIVSDTVTAL